MALRKPKVIVTRKLPDAVETRMRELFDAELNLDDIPMDVESLAAAVSRAEVLACTITDRIDGDVIARAGTQLKLIANFGVGVDHIDVVAANARGIIVTNTPGVLTDDTADLTMGLISPRRVVSSRGEHRPGRGVPRLDADVDDGPPPLGQAPGYRGHGADRPGAGEARARVRPGRSLSQPKTRRRANRRGTRSDLLGKSRPDAGAHRCDFRQLPAHAATYHLLSARRLKLLQPHAIVINTARGEIIDEAALAGMLQRGEIAGAGLDVYEHEPAINPKLLKLSNVVLLPHMSSATIEGRIEMGEKVIINIRTWMDGHKPPDRVIPSML